MPQEYYTLLTETGAIDLTNAQVYGVQLPITHIAVGDGGGQNVLPREDMTALVNEVFRIPITSIALDSENPNWLVVETVIPANTGGWFIREIGLIGGLNQDNIADTPTNPGNRLLAVGNFPETYKPLLAEGAAKDIAIRIIVQVSNASVVQLTIDPSVVVATKRSVDQAIQTHRDDANAHPNRYAPLSHLTAPDPHTQYFNENRLENRLAELINGTLHYVGQVWQIVPDNATLNNPVVTGPDAGRAEGARVIVTDYPASSTGHAMAVWHDIGGWAISDLPLNVFDLYGCDINRHGYYWFADEWNLLDLDNIGEATTETAGVVRLASAQDVAAGTADNRALTLEAIRDLLVPAGTVIWYAASIPPTGYLLCNGAPVARAQYPALFAAIGILYGAGDGQTTFNLPELRGEFIRAHDAGRGVDSGRVFGSFQADDFKSHTHPLAIGGSNLEASRPYIGTAQNTAAPRSTNAAGGTETRPRNVALLPCIKT
jgi:microcystin-dependent protein